MQSFSTMGLVCFMTGIVMWIQTAPVIGSLLLNIIYGNLLMIFTPVFLQTQLQLLVDAPALVDQPSTPVDSFSMVWEVNVTHVEKLPA
jgi:hypothetical protein